MPIKTRDLHLHTSGSGGKSFYPMVAELINIRRLLGSDNTPLAVRVYLKARRTAILNAYKRHSKHDSNP